jgi:hypothetical protein
MPDAIRHNEHLQSEGAPVYFKACELGCGHRVEKAWLALSVRRSKHWIKVKNPDSPAARRLEEEDWN